MEEKISTNLFVNLIITFGVGILGFIVNKYFAQYMGLEILGLMKLFTQIIAYLSLAELGIGSASTYALYRPLIEKDIYKINIIMSTIDFFYNKVIRIILIVGVCLSLTIPYFIKLDLYSNKIYFYWILYVINTAVGYIFAKYVVLFTANQEYGYVRKVQGFTKMLFQIIQIILLIKFGSFTIFILIMIFENLFNFYFYRLHYKKEYFYIKSVKEREKNIIKDMKNLFWHKIGGVVVHNTDYIVISKFISLSVVGVYSSYLMVYQIIVTAVNIITPVITPKIGTFVTKSTKNEIYLYWRQLQVVYIFLSTICIICTYYLIEPFIYLWLGDEFILSKLTIILILINLFLNLIKIITDTFKFACGFFDDTYAPILESIINLFFSLILVRKIGLNGVIIGTLISNILIITILKPILVFKRCFEKKIYNYIRDYMIFFLLVGISIVLTNKFIILAKINLTQIYDWNIFIKKSFLLTGITIISVFLTFLVDKKFRKFILSIIKKGDSLY